MLLVAHRSPVTPLGYPELVSAGAQLFEIDVQVRASRLVVSHYLPVRGFGMWLRRDGVAAVRRRQRAPRAPAREGAGVAPSDKPILLDLKETALDRRAELIDVLVKTLPNRERFVVCTPEATDLEQLRRKGFRTWLTIDDERQLARVLRGGTVHDDAVHDDAVHDDAVTVRHTLLTAEMVGRLHERVATVVAWTVNDVGRAGQLRDIGVDGLTTDSLAVMRAVGPDADDVRTARKFSGRRWCAPRLTRR